MLENAADVITILNSDGTVRYGSPAGERLTGYRPEERVGTDAFAAVHPDDRGQAVALFGEILEKPGLHPPLEFRVPHKDGSWRYMEHIVNNLLHEPSVRGIVINSRDVTERKLTEEALRESESSLTTAQRIAHLGNWDYGITKDRARWSDEMYRIFGFAPRQFVPRYRTFLNSVHPDDRDLIRRSVRNALYEEEQGSIDYRVVRPDGEVRIVQSRYEVTRDVSGRAVRLTGTVHDITERKQAEKGLKQSEERYRAVVKQTIDGIYLWAADTKIVVESNEALQEMLGYTAEELSGMHIYEFIAHDQKNIDSVSQSVLDRGHHFIGERRYRRKGGSIVDVETSATVIYYGDSEVLCTVVRDITERKEAEQRLAEAEKRYRTLVERIPVVTYIQELSSSGRVIYISPQYESLLGYSAEEVLSDPEHWVRILHPDDRERVLAEDERTNQTEEPFVVEYRQIAKDGSVVCIRDEATLVRNEVGGPLYWLGIQTDVTERKALEERLEHQALHDPLTDLPNRSLFLDRLGHALRRTGRKKGRRTAVLFLDLNNFKSVNDSLGHEVGDLLLVAVAGRLTGCLRPEDTLARFGGDEFVVLVEDVEAPDEPVRVAERIADGFRSPFVLDGKELYARVSVGIATGDARTKIPEDLVRDADTAMYRAKQADGTYEVFDPAMHERAVARLELENDLRRAVEAGEFVIHYQPKFRIQEVDTVAEVEALVRWEHPQRGLLMPDEFVPLAEETGLIVPIGRWVLKETCRQVGEWQNRYPMTPPLIACVNVAAGQLRYPDLLHEAGSALRESGIEGRSLALEITESALVQHMQTSTTLLKELRKEGIRFALDDFGSEYSSLSYLMQLPVDFVKIDKSFVWGLGEDPRAAVIVEAIISLAHSLGLEAVGEGVESAEQLESLRSMGCDLVQGYYLARPLPSDEVEQLLANRTTS